MRSLLPGLLLLTACGGFDNGPLRVGELRGRLENADPGKAFVAVLGAPSQRVGIDSAGNFVLGNLDVGAVELLAVGREDAARRVLATVEAARAVDLGTLALRPAGRIEVDANAPEHQRLSGGNVTVVGTPWQQVALDAEGNCGIRGVPKGCWNLELQVPGLGARTLEVCLEEGETRGANFALPTPDGSGGREGCGVTGCEVGYTCAGDGTCR